jgi:hypothetical protein
MSGENVNPNFLIHEFIKQSENCPLAPKKPSTVAKKPPKKDTVTRQLKFI